MGAEGLVATTGSLSFCFMSAMGVTRTPTTQTILPTL